MKNNIVIDGFVLYEPNTQNTSSGSKMCSIKISNRFNTYTSIVKIICFGKLAEYTSTLIKGDFIYVEGFLTIREYEGKMITEIRADNIFKNNIYTKHDIPVN